MIIQCVYFGFCQTFQLKKVVGDDVHRNWPISDRQPEADLNSKSFKHDSL